MPNTNGKARIVVRGPNILQPPILDTEDAKFVVFYDRFGDMNALLVRMTDDLWAMVTQNDPDWDAMRIRFGFMQPTSLSLRTRLGGKG